MSICTGVHVCLTLTKFSALIYEGWNSTHDNIENRLLFSLLAFLFLVVFLLAIVGSSVMTATLVGHYSLCVLYLSYGRDPLVCSDESACRQKHKALTKQITRNSLFKEGMFLVGWEDRNLLSFKMWGCKVSLSAPSARKIGGLTLYFAGVCCSRKKVLIKCCDCFPNLIVFYV